MTHAHDRDKEGPAIRNGRIRQAIVAWPYMLFGEKWDLAGLCRAARDLGCSALDLLGPAEWPTLDDSRADLRRCAQRHARIRRT